MRKGIPYDRTGNKNPKWRGGRIKRPDGRICVYAPDHPGANLYGGTHILEYRLIAEQITGRPLFNNEIVHHKNGDATDNRLENLEVITQSEHAKTHLSGELSPNHKLTMTQVVFIRESNLSTPKLSKLLGVSIASVWRARKGITWKSILTS
jgi:DNA-binding transcriptional regulator YiaG